MGGRLRLIKHYSLLWALPESHILGFYLTIILIFIFLTSLINGCVIQNFLSLTMLALALFISSKIDELLTIKRFLGYMTLLSLLALINTLSSFFKFIKPIEVIVFVMIIAYIVSSIYFILRKVLAMILSIASITLFSIYHLSTNISPLSSLFMIITTLSLAFLFIIYLELSGKKKFKLGPISTFKDFLSLWLSGNHRWIEEKLLPFSKTISCEAKIMTFKEGDESSIIVYIPFHPGPVMKLGGADLPSLIMYKASKMNNVALPFHKPSNHELDIVSSQDKMRILKKIFSIKPNKIFHEITSTRPIQVSERGITALGIKINNIPLIILSSPDLGGEDYEPWLLDAVEAECERLKFRDIILIDAHNNIPSSIVDMGEASRRAYKLILKIVELLLTEEEKPVKIGWAKAPPIDSPKKGFGIGGVSVFSIIGDDFKLSIILIDGNNIVREIRDRIVLKLKKKGIQAEVCTTDTHSVVALAPGKRGYIPVGENYDKKKIIKWIENCVEESIRKTHDPYLFIAKMKLNNIHVFGDILISLDEMVEKSIKWARIYPYYVAFISTLSWVLFQFIPYLP